jgi:hypothetical protein
LIGTTTVKHQVDAGITLTAEDIEVGFLGMFLVEVEEGTELGTAAGNVLVMGDDIFDFVSDFHNGSSSFFRTWE